MPNIEITSRRIANFFIALEYVRQACAELYALARVIELAPATAFFYNVNGNFFPDSKRVRIRAGRRTVADFIETIAHELKHAEQHAGVRPLASRDERENEACRFAWEVRTRYVREVEMRA